MSESIGKDKLSLQWVSSTEQGRQFIWEILSYCGIYHDLAGDPNDVFKSLGKRQVGLHLLDILGEVDEELIFSMMREAKNRKIQQEIKDDNTSDRRKYDHTADIIGTSDTDDSFSRGHESGNSADL